MATVWLLRIHPTQGSGSDLVLLMVELRPATDHILRVPAAQQAARGHVENPERTSADHWSLTMRDFIKPLRRKAGVVTLGWACVLAAL